MEADRIIKVCGSVIKKESIVPLNANIMENTSVAEASEPYFNYYGSTPENPVPNSLFLFTVPCYSLEEVLRFLQKSDACFKEKINVASALLDVGQNQYPAIRIKYFPDYKHLAELQKCFEKAGVQFTRKVPIQGEATVRIHKCFVLKEVEKGIFIDQMEENKGYILADTLLNEDEFRGLMAEIRNNSDCRLFDAAKCGIILDSEVKEVVRVFSEKLDLALLKCIQRQMKKLLKRNS
jgi:hypothetical protein